MSVLVRAHRDLPLAFPPECIECGAAHPDSKACVLRVQSADHALTFHRIDAPACGACAQRLVAKRRTHLLGLVIGFALAIAVFVLFTMYGRQLPKWTIWGVTITTLACVLVPVWYFRWKSPLPVRMVRQGSGFQQLAGVNYVLLEFRDSEYGRRFAALNQ